MVRNSRGTLSGNTRKLRGKMGLTVSEQVKTFEIGAKVIVSPRSTSKGQPAMRYKGKHGIVRKRQGKSYVVEVEAGAAKRYVVASPIHLKSA